MEPYAALEMLGKEAQKHGDRLAAISVDHLVDVKRDFDDSGIDDISQYYRFEPRDDLGFAAQSILVVASPSPLASVVFNKDGEKKTVTIPPTYVGMEKQEAAIEQYLQSALHEYGFAVTRAGQLPCKPIAVHAGLGLFGRNSLVYVDGMGSFVRLSLFFSDMPCQHELFYPLRRHDACQNCNRCVDNCPAGGLTHQRDYVNYDRCLTTMNERAEDFPDWVKPEWHHALIGCMKCQCVCPLNKPYMECSDEIVCYSAEETLSLINGELPDALLAPLGMEYCHQILPRNVAALLRQV